MVVICLAVYAIMVLVLRCLLCFVLVEFTLKALEPVISELEDVDKNLCRYFKTFQRI